ncbi:MAG: 3-oxoacyl-[acyl-carrier-protein] synthase [Acidobacteriota bacterium]|nr:3-oxoacyl-[acyl-carrier-protein] synthase [Acidobacteriota bacterium]
MARGRIKGTGMAVPDRVLTNADLEKMVDTKDEWILTRTGIRERRIAAPGESLSTFAVPAARAALEMAGVAGKDVDLVLCATVTPDTPFPATANVIQDRIGATRAGSFDLSAGCTGFIYALTVGEQFIESGMAKNVLIVGGEILSKITDWSDRGTCVLFGDGAGAVLLQATEEENRGVLGCAMHSDGSLGELIYMPGGGSKNPPSALLYESGLAFLKMRGNETFKIAVRSLAEVSQEVLARAHLSQNEVTWFIPHQANLRIIEAVGKRLEIPDGSTYVNIDRYGNTSSASIPIALDELNRAGKIAPGDVVLMSAFGAGLTWGAAVLRW